MDNKRTFSCFCGIRRSETPGWEGWKIIDYWHSKKIPAQEIQSPELECLIRCFWLVHRIREIDHLVC